MQKKLKPRKKQELPMTLEAVASLLAELDVEEAKSMLDEYYLGRLDAIASH